MHGYTAFLNLFSTCSGAVIGATWTAYGLALGVAASLLDCQNIWRHTIDQKKLQQGYDYDIWSNNAFCNSFVPIVSDNEMLLDCTMKCASSKAKCIAKKGLHFACTAVSAIPVGINCNSLYIVKKDQKEMRKSQEFL